MSVRMDAQACTHIFIRMEVINHILVSNREVIVFFLKQMLFNK